MAKIKSSITPSGSADDGGTPETDSEHSQRFLDDIDRATWRGGHPPSSKGPRGIVHRIGVAEQAPHIFKAK
jgi:hypothetical protein